MCLINFSYLKHPNYKLIVAANRDEFYGRPTAPAHFWQDQPSVLAGRDLEKYGTWLGVTKQGRFAALTNYRSPTHMQAKLHSRGKIVSNYLTGNMTPENYIHAIQQKSSQYSGFNLLLGDANHLMYYNNIDETNVHVDTGTHSLSNHFLNTPWPKVKKGKSLLNTYVMDQQTIDPEVLFTILANDEQADDLNLPDTGVGLSLERQLSPLFIDFDQYGTRCSTVLLITTDDELTFIERTFHHRKFIGEEKFSFTIQK